MNDNYKFILENHEKMTYMDMAEKLKVNNQYIRNVMCELRQKGLIDKFYKPIQYKKFYIEEIQFLLKYYQIFQHSYMMKRLNLSRNQLDYILSKLGFKLSRKKLTTRYRQILYLQYLGYNSTQIKKILKITYANYNTIRKNMYKLLKVHNCKEAADWVKKNNLGDLLLFKDELKKIKPKLKKIEPKPVYRFLKDISKQRKVNYFNKGKENEKCLLQSNN